MSDIVGSKEPSHAKYRHFEGPTPEEEHAALKAWNLKKAQMGPSGRQGGGNLKFGTPRKAKCRDLKVDGLRIK